MRNRALFTTEHIGVVLFLALSLLANLCACY